MRLLRRAAGNKRPLSVEGASRRPPSPGTARRRRLRQVQQRFLSGRAVCCLRHRSDGLWIGERAGCLSAKNQAHPGRNAESGGARIGACERLNPQGAAIWDVDLDRVKRVLVKLARGHVAYELGVPHFEDPDLAVFVPLVKMSCDERDEFESPEGGLISWWPEVGSRAFIGAVKGKAFRCAWKVVQEGRYRYRVSQSDGDAVRFVLSEYLACQIGWDS